MAGSNIEVSVDDRQVRRALARLQDAGGGSGYMERWPRRSRTASGVGWEERPTHTGASLGSRAATRASGLGRRGGSPHERGLVLSR